MLVYGDRSEQADATERARELAHQCAAVNAMPPGLQRHSALVSILIETGRLLQGVADRDFAETQQDRASIEGDALTSFLMEVADAVCRSWDSGFQSRVELPSPPDLAGRGVELRVPEGYAFYAVYPEAYADAARRLQLCARPRVIGIRSIGTSLAATVAAAIGAPPPVTVRPFGDPFARKIAVAPALEERLLDGEAHFVIVDEGPGQSGSSFGAVADWLQERGVPLERIAFMPSHAGEPGPQSAKANRTRWTSAQKVVADFGPRLPHILADWATELLGPLDRRLQDLSAGKWRAQVCADERHWPAVDRRWERRKYLASAGGRHVLLKFAGLGEEGDRKLRLARSLHKAGLVPKPLGLLHGFLAETWHGEGERLARDEKPLRDLARYIGARAALAADAEHGASAADLLDMAESNVREALGEDMARGLRHWRDRLPSLRQRIARVETDGRMDRHEWLRLEDGRLLKTDALDHHCGHDLIGAQDLAWDVAGACVEFALDEQESAWLAAAAGRQAARLIDPELLHFMTDCYLAFRLGQARMAAEAIAAEPNEAARLEARFDAYSEQLGQRLTGRGAAATRCDSPLGAFPERTGAGTMSAPFG